MGSFLTMRCPHCNGKLGMPQYRYEQRKHFLEMLEKNNWNRAETARQLGVCIRTVRTWVAHLRLCGVPVPDNERGTRKRPRLTEAR